MPPPPLAREVTKFLLVQRGFKASRLPVPILEGWRPFIFEVDVFAWEHYIIRSSNNSNNNNNNSNLWIPSTFFFSFESAAGVSLCRIQAAQGNILAVIYMGTWCWWQMTRIGASCLRVWMRQITSHALLMTKSSSALNQGLEPRRIHAFIDPLWRPRSSRGGTPAAEGLSPPAPGRPRPRAPGPPHPQHRGKK